MWEFRGNKKIEGYRKLLYKPKDAELSYFERKLNNTLNMSYISQENLDEIDEKNAIKHNTTMDVAQSFITDNIYKDIESRLEFPDHDVQSFGYIPEWRFIVKYNSIDNTLIAGSNYYITIYCKDIKRKIPSRELLKENFYVVVNTIQTDTSKNSTPFYDVFSINDNCEAMMTLQFTKAEIYELDIYSYPQEETPESIKDIRTKGLVIDDSKLIKVEPAEAYGPFCYLENFQKTNTITLKSDEYEELVITLKDRYENTTNCKEDQVTYSITGSLSVTNLKNNEDGTFSVGVTVLQTKCINGLSIFVNVLPIKNSPFKFNVPEPIKGQEKLDFCNIYDIKFPIVPLCSTLINHQKIQTDCKDITFYAFEKQLRDYSEELLNIYASLKMIYENLDAYNYDTIIQNMTKNSILKEKVEQEKRDYVDWITDLTKNIKDVYNTVKTRQLNYLPISLKIDSIDSIKGRQDKAEAYLKNLNETLFMEQEKNKQELELLNLEERAIIADIRAAVNYCVKSLKGREELLAFSESETYKHLLYLRKKCIRRLQLFQQNKHAIEAQHIEAYKNDVELLIRPFAQLTESMQKTQQVQEPISSERNFLQIKRETVPKNKTRPAYWFHHNDYKKPIEEEYTDYSTGGWITYNKATPKNTFKRISETE